MECIEVKQGFGLHTLTQEEQTSLETLCSLAGNARLCIWQQYRDNPRSNENKFMTAFERLFPSITERVYGDIIGGRTPPWNIPDAPALTKHKQQGVTHCLHVQTSITLEQKHYALLRIYRLATQPTHPMAIMNLTINENYTPSVIDDLVRVMGNYHTPHLEPVASVDLGDFTFKRYGIPRVSLLPETTALYAFAKMVLETNEKEEVISRKALDILHRDKEKHENIAVRMLSKEIYEKTLMEIGGRAYEEFKAQYGAQLVKRIA